MKAGNNKSCPSAVAHPGATLLGAINADGSVGFIETPITIDEAFLQEAGEGVALEKLFRFSTRCVQSGCKQWSQGNCTVIQRIIDAAPDWPQQHPALPACSIRTTCRWYAQEGADACSYCAFVTTNSME
jgi:hypothetical protein